MYDIEMTRNSISASSTMDKSSALSFTVNSTVPAPSGYSQRGAAALHSKSEAALVQNQGAVICCPHCKQQFQDHKLLLIHQQGCNGTAAPFAISGKATILSNNSSGSSATAGNGGGKVVARSNPAPVQNCLNTYYTRRQQLMLEDFARRKARMRDLNRRKRLREWEASHPISAHWAPKRKRAATPEPPPSKFMPQEDFLKRLGLVTSSSADRLKHEAERHGDVDLDCQIVAVEGPIAGEPFHSPRTTRSLMSQLSRESAETARKRLSFCLENEEASESEIFDGTIARRTTLGSLLSIDFASPLGQRLKKHMKSDLVVPPISDVELHCSEPILDGMAAKLRYRVPDYPIMHRKRKGIVTGYCHTFKFNAMERREFIKTLRTGLNAKSRRLLLMTKKCLIKLAKLRPEEIRLWTLRRRTIVNQEIAIDDDISIVQVDVPEHMFHAVQKMPVPSQNNVLCRQSLHEAGYRHSSVGSHAYQHHACSSLVSAMPYPYPTSCIRAPPPGPMPQFLVKQVSKNWTENGKESQKLVFVPLEEAGLPSVPGPRSLSHGSAQRSSKPSSSGIQKSLPRHLRPCPKSKRKQLMREKTEDSDESVTIKTASSSSDDENKASISERLPQEGVYPLSLSRAGGNVVHAPWMMPESPVPQMLHKAGNSTSAASSIPVGSSLLHPQGRSVSAGLVPQNSPGGESAQMLLYDGASQQVVAASSTRTVSEAENPLELRKKMSMFNLTRTSSASNSVSAKVEERNKTRGADNSSPGGFPHLSIDAVYSANDLSNEQLAASLGLECTRSSSRQPSTLQQPNFLQPEMRSLLGPNSSNPRPVPQPSSQSGHPDTAQDKGSSKYCPSQHPVLPKVPLKETPTHQQLTNNDSHHFSIVRCPGQLPSPSTAAAGKVSPTSLKPIPIQARSSKDWTVVRASDDDVVEVICIDDDE